MMKACLGMLLLALPSPLLASGGADSRTIEQALSQCLGSMSSRAPDLTPASDMPPGLSRGKDLHVEALPGMDGVGYTYEGRAAREEACGVAIYGPVPKSLENKLIKFVDGYGTQWIRHAPGPYKLKSAPARETYWGDPKAPGTIGVLMLSRQPAPDAPTLEIDYHKELLF